MSRFRSRSRSAPRTLTRHGRPLALVASVVVGLSMLGVGPAAAAAPVNDSRAAAVDIGSLPVTLQGTTVEATLEADDPGSQCSGALKGSVWYRFAPSASRSVLLAVTAAGDMDAVVEVFSRVRSQLDGVGCAVTDRRGEAVVDVDVTAGTSYLIRVAPLANSVAERFTLLGVAPDDPARAPGSRLPASGVAAAVDRFANPDDAWFVDLVRGRTYRINLVTKGDGCATVELFPAGTKSFGSANRLRRLSCDQHSVFVAEKSGRYPMLVSAPRASRTRLPYRLRVGAALADDTAPGVSLAVDRDTSGRLKGSELDALDLYRFGVTHRSDMRIRLRTHRHFELTLMTLSGRTLGRDSHVVERRLARGHYYLAVRSLDGADGSYVLRRHARTITSARMLANGRGKAFVGRGSSVSLTLQVSPAVSGPASFLVERFDPIEGWMFDSRFHPTVVAGRATVSYRPAGFGRWRVTGTFDGTSAASASFGGTATFSVVEPLTLSALAR